MRTGQPLAPPSIERALAAIRIMHQAADADPPQTKGARKVLSGYRERLALAKDPAARPRKADAAVPDGRMTPEAIADVVARIAAAAGLEGRWTDHSLRRGFATAARRAGANLERIGRHGGWADGSRALLGYLEEGDRWADNPVTGL
ncbi:tyrosine-type recombinase/integrase [Sphaerisporangium sp. NPDC004334]